MPFAMEPVVYDFAINERGTVARAACAATRADARRLLHADRAAAAAHASRACSRPRAAPNWTASRAACRTAPEFSGMVQHLFDHLLPRGAGGGDDRSQSLDGAAGGTTASTACSTSRSRPTCARGRIGLAQNRLPASSRIEDAGAGRPVAMPRGGLPQHYRETGMRGAGRRARWRWSRWRAASAAAGPRARAW